ncbi:MAG: tRNA pseudouridine13 synthase [Oleiphilaceae bacterium]|jgi:tRNA pseudouridine13 synthase
MSGSRHSNAFIFWSQSMNSSYELNFPRATTKSPAKGVIKNRVEDFYVEELLYSDSAGEGEHVWLWLEKQGQNTEYVAEKIAQFANVKLMDVGFSGLKDRWAVTRQWFSVYLGNKPEPVWSDLDLEGVEILKHDLHLKKLRRGQHSANKFKIVIRSLEQAEFVEEELKMIRERGFPNYFGAQRFGFNGANLERGERFFSGKLKASRSQRSFYLSAARSFLFNLNLSRSIVQGTWISNELGGPLYGDESPGVNELSEVERDVLKSYPVFAGAIYKNRLKLERRLYSIVPDNFSWKLDNNILTLSFELPPGCFATSLISEFMEYDVGLGAAKSGSV